MFGILLAAGFSRRFGAEDKLRQMLPHGECMAVSAAKNLIQAVPDVIAVVKHDDAVLATLFAKEGLQVVFCPPDANSMATSLITGVLALQQLSAKACVIALADMPFIKVHTIATVAHAVQPGGIVIPSYHGQRGHPVAFAREYFADLCAIQGDQGARAVVQQHAEHVTVLPCEDAGILQDIDTPAMLAQYRLLAR